ncbi:VCBS repeat-containing protein, partial [Candidatus Sumerlaeota bacterium]|nr:VCBS repeat-containing protein [Candidatus Sumerlaeota bacterium]
MACSFNALAGDPPAPELLWRSKLNYSFAAPPAAADINLDGSFEIVVLSADNHVSLLSPSSQKTLWETKLTAKGQFSYAPAIGNFLGRGGLEIALVSSEGHLTLLEGGTGAVSLEGELGSGVAQAPTVYPIRPEDLGGEEFRDGLAVVSSGGTVFGFILHAGVALQPSFQFDLVGIVNHPVMVVHTGYEKPEPHLGVVTSEGTVHVLSAYPGSKDKISYQLDRGINNTWPAAGDVNGDGLDDLLIADDAGFLHALTVHGATVSRIWEKSSIDSKPSQNIALIDVNGDGRDDILVPRETRQFILINGASGKRDIWTGDSYFNHDADVKAPPAIFYGADKKAYAVLSDEAADHETVCVLDLKARTLKNDAQTQPVRIDTGGYSQTTPVVGPLSGGTEAEVFVMGWRTGAGYLAGLGMEANRSAPLWLGDHGGPRKTSNLSIAGQDYLNRQREALLKKVEDNVAKARGLYQEGRWKDAIGALEAALAANPGNAEAQKLLHSAKLRKNLIWIILALLAAIPALGFGGWQGTRALARLSRIKQSQAALAKGDKQRAAKLMLGIYKATRAPSPAAIKQLADLFIELKKYEPDTLEIFSKARDLNPKDGRYLHALAMVCFTGNRQDADAVKIYEEMHENEAAFGDPPGRWAFMLGQAHLKLGHDDKAMKCLKEALKQRYEEALTTTYLGDLYVRMNITRPEILPVLTPLLPERENDKIFLLVYCKAAQEGRNFDDAAQRAARALLDLDPTVPEAHVILASVLLQSGQVKDSLHHAEAILQRDPNDSVGLRLLGACYAAENRLDETAMEIFQKGLAANPEAQEIL